MVSTIKNKLTINRLKLKDGVQKFKQEVTAEDLSVANTEFIGPIVVDLEIFKNGDTIVVSGKVNFRALLCCVSCLENYERDFSEKAYQEYIKAAKPMPVATARLEEIDFVREYCTSDFFDLTPLVRDTILLSVPVAPWCRDDCPGVKE